MATFEEEYRANNNKETFKISHARGSHARGINLDDLGDLVCEEMAALIDGFAKDERASYTSDIQPPESVIQEMAQAAANVLIAFERGYRLGK